VYTFVLNNNLISNKKLIIKIWSLPYAYMNVIIKYRARAKYVISYLKFNNPIRKKTIFDEFLYGSYKYIIHERTKYEGDRYSRDFE
jgi:hypothetical protein